MDLSKLAACERALCEGFDSCRRRSVTDQKDRTARVATRNLYNMLPLRAHDARRDFIEKVLASGM